MLLKSIHARDPWDQGDIDTILKADFSRDGQIKLDVSVYNVGIPDLIRIFSEHFASTELGPAGGCMIDVNGILRNPQWQDPLKPWFSFLHAAHYNEYLPDELAVRTFVAKLVVDRANRLRSITKDEVRAHVRKCKAARDREWLNYFQNCRVGRRWEKL